MDTISRFWLSLIERVGLSERFTFLFGVYLVSEVLYLSIAGFYYLCWKRNWLLRYRVQKAATMPDDALIRKCLEEVCIRSALVRIPFLFVLFDVFKFFKMEVYASIPPWPTVIRHWVIALAVNDTLFYWTHRLMHHRRLYKYSHKKHHEFRVNISINSEYAGMVEVALCDVLPTFAGCLLQGSHLVILLGWISFRVWETCAAHSGYALPWCPFTQVSVFNGPQIHDFHHSHNMGTYGAVTRCWDAWMGTDRHYEEYARRYYDPFIPRKGKLLSQTFFPNRASICALASAVSEWWEGDEPGTPKPQPLRRVNICTGATDSGITSSSCSSGGKSNYNIDRVDVLEDLRYIGGASDGKRIDNRGRVIRNSLSCSNRSQADSIRLRKCSCMRACKSKDATMISPSAVAPQ